MGGCAAKKTDTTDYSNTENWAYYAEREAIEVFRESLRIREHSYGHDSKFTAMSMRNLARTLKDQNDPTQIEEARRLLLDALEIRKKLNTRKFLAMAYVDLAEFNLIHGEPQQVIDYLDQAMNVYNGTASKPDLGKCFDIYGKAYLKMKNDLKAEEYFRKALELQNDKYQTETKERLKEIAERIKKQ